MTTACDICLRRTDLIAALVGRIDVERRRSGRRLGAVLARPDAQLLALDPTGGAIRRYRRFDPEAARKRIVAAGLQASCACDRDWDGEHRLSDLHDPPAVLHASSHACLTEIAAEPAVAIVGARRASAYGLEVAYGLARGLARGGVPVISGMALGVDSAAHTGCLDGGGRTLAVLAGGADVPYPRSRQQLYRRIRGSGAVISELPPGQHAARWCFPARNRLIAALATVVVVVEAAGRSGSLITADFAEQLGRGVAAVPGPITARLSDGVNALIRHGAAPVRHLQDLVDELLGAGAELPTPARAAGESPSLDPQLLRLLDAIEGGRATLAALVHAQDQIGFTLLRLAELERRGLIRREGGGRYVRTTTEIGGTPSVPHIRGPSETDG